MSAWTRRSSDGKAAGKIAPPRPRIPSWKGLGADSEEKRAPVSDIDTAAADSLKVLDPKRPIREADIARAALSALARPNQLQFRRPCSRNAMSAAQFALSQARRASNLCLSISLGTSRPMKTRPRSRVLLGFQGRWRAGSRFSHRCVPGALSHPSTALPPPASPHLIGNGSLQADNLFFARADGIWTCAARARLATAGTGS
jgi:hypothetical protein